MAVARILFRADFSFLKIRFVSVALFVLQNNGSWVERRAQFWLPEADLTQTWLVYADRHRVVTKAKVSSFTGQVVNKCEFKWCYRFQLFKFKNKFSFSFFLSFYFYDIDFFAKKEVLLSALNYLQVFKLAQFAYLLITNFPRESDLWESVELIPCAHLSELFCQNT